MFALHFTMQSDDSSRSPTPMENSQNVGVDNQVMQGGDGEGQRSERSSSLARAGGRRKRDRMLISDDSDDSSLDSSDNDFEEQIRKLKVSCVCPGMSGF